MAMVVEIKEAASVEIGSGFGSGSDSRNYSGSSNVSCIDSGSASGGGYGNCSGRYLFNLHYSLEMNYREVKSSWSAKISV